MAKKKDLNGKVFGNFIVVREAGRDKWGKVLWLCECQCKNKTQKYLTAYLLESGQVVSCGCVKKERASKLNPSRGHKKNPQLYNAWQNMKKRCSNPDNEYYGGRGITYDSRWEDVENFFADMAESWEEGLTLDRIDFNKGYCKENCRWVNMKVQSNNRRNNRYIDIEGEVKQLWEWSETTGIAESTIWCRYEAGVKGNDLITKNPRPVATKKSGVKGIIWNKKSERWVINVLENGKKKRIGTFKENELEEAKERLKSYLNNNA
ncbi:hypothetical protein [Bacillus cereus]|uniref:AP2 domain-containing protein n=1 Tax=Bacillus cereus HuA3-9 TaxID=1053205 RepID=R8CI67_BACCE|nr:hypothetical protein [Bacillus cereus]EOO11316.1 hypothetical protein IGA_05579 [Bacillus cereus HuA3-9]